MMNERIKELANQAWPNLDNDPRVIFSSVDVRRFAELIIRECAQVANDSNHSKNRAVGVSVGDVIRTYFGIK